MSNIDRRNFLKMSAGLAAGAATGDALAASKKEAAKPAAAAAHTLNLKPEKGAKLRVLRWSRFVQVARLRHFELQRVHVPVGCAVATRDEAALEAAVDDMRESRRARHDAGGERLHGCVAARAVAGAEVQIREPP